MTNDNREERLKLTITDCPWCQRSHSHILHVKRSLTQTMQIPPSSDVTAGVIASLFALAGVALTALWPHWFRQRALQEKVTHDVILMCPRTNREFIATIEIAGDYKEFVEER